MRDERKDCIVVTFRIVRLTGCASFSFETETECDSREGIPAQSDTIIGHSADHSQR